MYNMNIITFYVIVSIIERYCSFIIIIHQQGVLYSLPDESHKYCCFNNTAGIWDAVNHNRQTLIFHKSVCIVRTLTPTFSCKSWKFSSIIMSRHALSSSLSSLRNQSKEIYGKVLGSTVMF